MRYLYVLVYYQSMIVFMSTVVTNLAVLMLCYNSILCSVHTNYKCEMSLT